MSDLIDDFYKSLFPKLVKKYRLTHIRNIYVLR